jgi:hypothetical protein
MDNGLPRRDFGRLSLTIAAAPAGESVLSRYGVVLRAGDHRDAAPTAIHKSRAAG